MTESLNDAFDHRRPNVGRGNGITPWVTGRLSNLGITPNQISALGLVMGVIAGALFAAMALSAVPWITAILGLAGIVAAQLRLACNLFDGTVAQHSGQHSALGAMWNELPDRVSDFALFTGLGFAAGSTALGMTVGALAISTAYLREYGRAAFGSSDFSGIFAKPGRVHIICLVVVISLVVPGLAPAVSGSVVLITGLIILALGTAITALQRLQNLAALARKGQG